MTETEVCGELMGGGYPADSPIRILLVATPEGIRESYDDRWCYTTKTGAEKALAEWTGDEPHGWIRNPLSGRRRPDGDASKEYVSR